MSIYKVNADFLINVDTYVDTDDIYPPDITDLEESIKSQAIAQFYAGNYEPRDPIDEPKINWMEEED